MGSLTLAVVVRVLCENRIHMHFLPSALRIQHGKACQTAWACAECSAGRTILSNDLYAIVAGQVISVKRLAPYRNDRYTARPNWQKMQELRDQKATAVAARKPRSSKTKHKLRSHEKAALYAQEAAQGGARLPHTAAAKSGSKPGSKHSIVKHTSARKPGSNSSTQTATKEQAAKPDGSMSYVSGAATGPQSPKQPAEADKGNGMAPSNTAAKDASKKARDQERRLQSYSKLTLRKDGPSASSKKRSAAQAEVTMPDDAGSGLGKQVKKRLKRTAKRAAARAAAGHD